jgi:hypothetical protein
MCYAEPTVFVRDVENRLRLRLLTGDRISNRIIRVASPTAVLTIQGGLEPCALTVTLESTTVRMVKSSIVN